MTTLDYKKDIKFTKELKEKLEEFHTQAREYTDVLRRITAKVHEAYEKEIDDAYRRYEEAFTKIMKTLADLIDAQSESFVGHSQRVRQYAELVGQKLGLSYGQMKVLLSAATLHDVGRIGIDNVILNKPGKLTEEEYAKVKQHPLHSEHMLSSIEFLQKVRKIVRHHHERWDGKGYPDNLRGNEIPLESRILAVVDAYEAMTQPRPYREKMTPEEALKNIEELSGKQFDPRVVEALISIYKEGLLDKI